MRLSAASTVAGESAKVSGSMDDDGEKRTSRYAISRSPAVSGSGWATPGRVPAVGDGTGVPAASVSVQVPATGLTSTTSPGSSVMSSV